MSSITCAITLRQHNHFIQAGAEPLIDGDVELKRVTFAYPARPGRLIFKEFNLKVKAGSSCALVSWVSLCFDQLHFHQISIWRGGISTIPLIGWRKWTRQVNNYWPSGALL